ncbi:MAG: hypothetical protein HFJ33_03645 [Clostridia bacterium]|nr:hypothetical protein [Clostridia bacterium]
MKNITNARKNEKQNKGITLIALVITIVVLLILAGISIATLTGNNGILSKASTAEEETKKKEYEEILKIIGNGLKPDKIINYESSEEYMTKYTQKINEDKNFENAKVTLNKKKNPITIVVETRRRIYLLDN